MNVVWSVTGIVRFEGVVAMHTTPCMVAEEGRSRNLQTDKADGGGAVLRRA